jgi:hypothetical protein
MGVMGSRGLRLAAFVTLGAAALIAIVSVVERFGGPIDPTEHSFPVTIRNDTAAVVVVRQCDVTCASFHETNHLKPGAEVMENATDEADVTEWLVVTTTHGMRLGCIALHFDHKVRGLVELVSRIGPCP